MNKIDNDEELKRFVNALVLLCQEFNLALQNTKVWRPAVAHVTPGSGLPKDLTQKHPEFVKRLIKLCQEYGVQLSAETLRWSIARPPQRIAAIFTMRRRTLTSARIKEWLASFTVDVKNQLVTDPNAMDGYDGNGNPTMRESNSAIT